jgi:IMP dehydrogenase/GMP reductase
MSYLGVSTIEDMPKYAEFIKISQAGWQESKPHAK